VDAADVDNLLRRAVRPGALDPADLAASLAEESEFEGTDDERQVKNDCIPETQTFLRLA